MTYKRYVLSLDFILEEDGKKIKVDRLGAASLAVPVLQRADGTLMEAKIRTEDFRRMADMVEQFIKTEETERKTGKWKENDNGSYSCSLCQSWIPSEQRSYARYCLHCGAKME